MVVVLCTWPNVEMPAAYRRTEKRNGPQQEWLGVGWSSTARAALPPHLSVYRGKPFQTFVQFSQNFHTKICASKHRIHANWPAFVWNLGIFHIAHFFPFRHRSDNVIITHLNMLEHWGEQWMARMSASQQSALLFRTLRFCLLPWSIKNMCHIDAGKSQFYPLTLTLPLNPCFWRD